MTSSLCWKASSQPRNADWVISGEASRGLREPANRSVKPLEADSQPACAGMLGESWRDRGTRFMKECLRGDSGRTIVTLTHLYCLRVDLPASRHLTWQRFSYGVHFRSSGSEHDHEETHFHQVVGRRCNRGRGRRIARFRQPAEDEDHAGAGLPAAESESAVQSERCGGHDRDRRRNHRHRRRRIEGHAVPVRRPTDRPRSAVYRTALAGHEPRLLLSGGTREDPCHRRARSCVVGHQGQSAEPAGARTARRHGAQLL